MIDPKEFLGASGIPLAKKVSEWLEAGAVDEEFVGFAVQHHSDLDWPHVELAMVLVKDFDRGDSRRVFEQYMDSENIALRHV